MSSFDKLVEIFSEFPGIGPRQAKRFVNFLLTRDLHFIKSLLHSIEKLKEETSACKSCHRFFSAGLHPKDYCNICSDKNRSNSVLMIVSHDVDLDNIEKTKSFDGKYFVLGGTVPILEIKPDTKIRARELLHHIEKTIKSGVVITEIILALSANPEGENTVYYLEKILSNIVSQNNIKISKLGRGLSTGTELEYSDADTIKNALKNRG